MRHTGPVVLSFRQACASSDLRDAAMKFSPREFSSYAPFLMIICVVVPQVAVQNCVSKVGLKFGLYLWRFYILKATAARHIPLSFSSETLVLFQHDH